MQCHYQCSRNTKGVTWTLPKNAPSPAVITLQFPISELSAGEVYANTIAASEDKGPYPEASTETDGNLPARKPKGSSTISVGGIVSTGASANTKLKEHTEKERKAFASFAGVDNAQT